MGGVVGKRVWLKNGLRKRFLYATKIKRTGRAKEHTTHKKDRRRAGVDERKEGRIVNERAGGQARKWGVEVDGLVPFWLDRATSGGTVLSSSYVVNT